MRLLTYPRDEMRLRRRATALPSDAFNTPQIRQLAEALADALEPIDGVDVLASTQVDFDPCWRILVMRTASGSAILCNPRVRSHEGEAFELGACASFACVPERTICPRKVVVEYRRIDGRMAETECGPSGARALWQGIDSLDGKLYLDRMSVVQRGPFLERVRARRMQEGRARA